MRHSAGEKLELIRLVEGSELSVRQTLAELGVARSTFYGWYRRYRERGPQGLADRRPHPGVCWNRIPDSVRQQVVDTALAHPDKSPRELAWLMTDSGHGC